MHNSSEYNKEYYQKHKDELRETHKKYSEEYYRKHNDEKRKYNKEYYQIHKDEINEKRRIKYRNKKRKET